MGSACEILLESETSATFDIIGEVLTAVSDPIQRTRKGRVWDIWVRGRPVHVEVERSCATIHLSAGCHDPEDEAILRQLAAALGGSASNPSK